MKRQSRIRKSGSSTASNGADGGDSQWMKTFSQFTTEHNYLVKYIILAVFALLGAIVYFRSSAVIQNLNNASNDALKTVIFGEHPYLLFCDRVGKAENIPAVFTEVNSMRSSTVGFAAVNCSQVLPSGKSLWERFKLKKEIRPTIFGAAPWMKTPLQVPANYMKDSKSLAKFVDTVMAPKATEVTSDKELTKFCGFDKPTALATSEDDITDTCLVLLRGKTHSKIHAELERRLVLAYPKTRTAAMDANKRRLSFEDEDTVMEMLPADSFALKLFALRNGTHYMPMVQPVTWDYMNAFVMQALSSALYDYVPTAGKKNITMTKPIAAATSPTAGAAGASKSTSQTRSKTQKKQQDEQQSSSAQQAEQGEDDEARTAAMQNAVKAAARAAQAKRERQRREEMERQQREFVATEEAATAGDEGSSSSATMGSSVDGSGDEDDSEDVIEL